MRAYRASDANDNGFITESEFTDLLRFLAYYDMLYQEFDAVDTDDDRRMDFAEFKKGHQLAGIKVSDSQLKDAFAQMDRNVGGLVLFDEFCMYMATNYRPKELDARLGSVAEKNSTVHGGSDIPKALKPVKPPVRAVSPALIAHQPQQQPQAASMTKQPSHLADTKKEGAATTTSIPTGPIKLTTKLTDADVRALFKRFDITNNNGL